jgi:hypothetical protein
MGQSLRRTRARLGRIVLLRSTTAGPALAALGGAATAFSYRLSRRGQVTDRFTKALERLGAPELHGEQAWSGLHSQDPSGQQ